MILVSPLLLLIHLWNLILHYAQCIYGFKWHSKRPSYFVLQSNTGVSLRTNTVSAIAVSMNTYPHISLISHKNKIVNRDQRYPRNCPHFCASRYFSTPDTWKTPRDITFGITAILAFEVQLISRGYSSCFHYEAKIDLYSSYILSSPILSSLSVLLHCFVNRLSFLCTQILLLLFNILDRNANLGRTIKIFLRSVWCL